MKYLTPLIALSIALCTWSCTSGDTADSHDHEAEDPHAQHDHDHGAAHVHGEAEEAGGTDEIVLEPEVAARMGVTTVTLAPGEFSQIVKVAGQVMPAATDDGVAVAPTAGIVTLSADMNPGRNVGAGSVIARVSAKNISGGDTNEAARVAIDAARRELERARPLVEEGLITRREFNEIQSRYDAAVAAYSPKGASGTVTSPLAGVVTALLVRQGEYVEAGQPIARIAKNSRLTLRADLPQRYYNFLPTIVSANFRADHSTETVELSHFNPQLSTGSAASASGGYLPVYFTFNNPGGVMPGSYVEVWLIGQSRPGVLSVPLTALTEQQGETYVYVQLDEECYERRLVKTGASDGVAVEVLSGLSAGDKVVTQGATVIRLAENSGNIPEGHSHNH